MFSSLRKTARWVVAGTAIAVAGSALAEETPKLGPGDEAPAFTLPGTDGEEHSLAAQRGRSNVILVFYRGVW